MANNDIDAKMKDQKDDKTKDEALRKWMEYVAKIHYSEVYEDDQFQYRHVILPKPLLRMLPKTYFNSDDSGTLRLLTEQEWRGMGVTQSLGWVHYEVHTPEPHVMLFRRDKNFKPPTAQQNAKPARR